MSDFQFKLERCRIDKIPKAEMVEELKKVAQFYKFIRFTRHDYDKIAKICKGSAILAEFGTWQNALDSIGIGLKTKEVDRSIIQTQTLFDEMEKIWKSLGHRPSKTEWDLAKPKHPYSTYKRRFGSWTSACQQFIEYKMGKPILVEEKKINITQMPLIKIDTKNQKEKREIPLKIRLQVFKRDNFCCTLCGKSPATHPGTVLHIDHIFPYSKGGKTTHGNLQTLCAECNWGKGNKP